MYFKLTGGSSASDCLPDPFLLSDITVILANTPSFADTPAAREGGEYGTGCSFIARDPC
jgi:hypothetical protein